MISHYIYTLLNVLYIFYSYSRINFIHSISPLLIQRIGIEKYQRYQIQISALSLFAYLVILIVSSLIFYPIPTGYEGLLVVFLVIFSVVMTLIEILLNVQIFMKPSPLFLVIALLINFIYRYGFIIPWAEHYFK